MEDTVLEIAAVFRPAGQESYLVIVDPEIQNGTVKIAGTGADSGRFTLDQAVQLTVAAGDGCRLERLWYSYAYVDSYDEIRTEEVEIEPENDCYVFYMPPCDVTIHADFAPITYSIAAYSSDELCRGSVSNISVSPDQPWYNWGDTVTLAAEAKDGYDFLGWYYVTGVSKSAVTGYGGTRISADLNAAVSVSDLVTGFALSEPGDYDEVDIGVVAVYQASSTDVTVAVIPVNGAEFTVKIGGENYPDPNGQAEVYDHTCFVTVPLGGTLTLTARDATDLQWKNESDKILGTGRTLGYVVSSDTKISLVYREVKETRAFLQFVTDYGQVLSYAVISVGSEIEIPTPPAKLGYTFEGWVIDGTNTVLREAEEITAAIRALVGNEESPQELITLKPKYTAIADRYTVTVQHVNAQGASVGAGQSIEGVQIGKTCTVTAPAIEGYVFGYWMDEAGNTLGYGSSYFMMVSKNTTLKAVYVTDPAEVQAKPAMVLDELYPTTAGDVHKVSGMVTRTIPDGYSLIEHGVLYAKDLEDLTDENFRYGITEGIKRYVSTDTKKNGVVNLHVKVTDDDTVVWFRGYMVVKNESTGELETCWSNIRSRSFAS